MATKIRKVIAEVEQDVERVLLRFKSHVRHDGKDYHAGDTAPIQAEAAATLVQNGVAEAAPAAPTTPADPNGNAPVDANAKAPDPAAAVAPAAAAAPAAPAAK